jgi:hypothetical protein
MSTPRLALLLTILLAAGCARGTPLSTPGTRNVITAEQIAETSATDAYEAVQRLRPEFLRGRGPTSVRDPNPTLPVVFLDNTRLGGLQQLRNIPVQIIETIEYLSASDATTRWGTGYTGGAIEVRTRS